MKYQPGHIHTYQRDFCYISHIKGIWHKTMDRAAFHNPLALFFSSCLHIREGVKTELIITQGNQAIWRADQWLPWLMALLSRWMVPSRPALPNSCYTDRENATVLIVKVTFSDYAMQRTNQKQEVTQSSKAKEHLLLSQSLYLYIYVL